MGKEKAKGMDMTQAESKSTHMFLTLLPSLDTYVVEVNFAMSSSSSWVMDS
jgi:hypothetical protein